MQSGLQLKTEEAIELFRCTKLHLPLRDGRLFKAIEDFIKYTKPIPVTDSNVKYASVTKKGGGQLRTLDETVLLTFNSLDSVASSR